MPVDAPATDRHVDTSCACVLSLDAVDELNDAAHRIRLYGTLAAQTLDDQCRDNLPLEAACELVTLILGYATTVEHLIARGSASPRAVRDAAGESA